MIIINNIVGQWTAIPLALIMDDSLSYAARGVYMRIAALPTLVKLKQRKLKALTEEYRLQRATLEQEIRDINGLINKIRTEFL